MKLSEATVFFFCMLIYSYEGTMNMLRMCGLFKVARIFLLYCGLSRFTEKKHSTPTSSNSLPHEKIIKLNMKKHFNRDVSRKINLSLFHVIRAEVDAAGKRHVANFIHMWGADRCWGAVGFTTTVGVVVLMLFPIIDTFLINDNELFICAYV